MKAKLYVTEKTSDNQIVIRQESGESIGASKKNKKVLSFAVGNEPMELLCGDSHSIWRQHQETDEQREAFDTVRQTVAEGEIEVEL